MADLTVYQLMKIATEKTRRTGFTACLERTNPLHGLSLRDAQAIYDSARMGNYTRLQYIYHEIERTDPVLMTCVERRAAALAGLGWKVGASAAANDPALADAQKDAVTKLAESLFNLDETVEHLALAFFRGFSHARIICDERGVPTGFDLVENYNFAYDSKARQWWWNPDCIFGEPGTAGMIPVPHGELVSVIRPRAIDYPALSIYIRHALAEKSWGRFLERYGIPPVNVTMPENATEEDLKIFLEAAAKLNDGSNGAWPAGTGISYAGEARGVNPFTDFIDHQEKLIVLLATGGTLTSLAEAGSGTLAGNAQMDVWEQIVSRDAVIIGAALNREVFRPYLKALFPGQPIVATFELGKEMEAAPTEVFEIGAKAKAAGYTIAQEDLEEASGYTLVKDETPAAQPGSFGFNSAAPVENAAPVAPTEEPTEEKSEPSPVIKAFIEDAGPAAEAVKALMESPTPDAAKDLMAKLPDLIGDKALAAVIADEMAKAMGETLEADAVANKQLREEDGKFGGSDGTGGDEPKEEKESDEVDKDDKHTPEQKARMKAFAESVDQDAVAWRNRCLAMDPEERKKQAYIFGRCSDKMAADIKAKIGLDTTGWPIEIQGNQLQHMDKRHGAMGQQDKTMDDPNDFGRIGFALKNYDDIQQIEGSRAYIQKQGEYSPQFALLTQIDGTMVVAEAVPDTKKKTIQITSAYQTKKKVSDIHF